MSVGAGLLTACRSPDTHRRMADDAAQAAIAEQQQSLYGSTTPIDIDRPSHRLRQKLTEEQGLPSSAFPETPPSEPEAQRVPFLFTLEQALQIGARNHTDLQAAKESIFKSALELDLRRDRFRMAWPALLGVTAIEDRSSASSPRGLEGKAAVGATWATTAGAEWTMRLTYDLVKLLTLDRDSAYGLLADIGLSVPLLR
ncbi:MAG: hypothetical protein U1E27_03860, partial [Kiritimatiellia bacterium]|nr:hypothetical protein [Kiritimatiellia bacterium]